MSSKKGQFMVKKLKKIGLCVCVCVHLYQIIHFHEHVWMYTPASNQTSKPGFSSCRDPWNSHGIGM